MAASFVRCRSGRCPQILRLLLAQSQKKNPLHLRCYPRGWCTTYPAHQMHMSQRMYSVGTETDRTTLLPQAPVLKEDEVDPSLDYTERYIPITRQTLIRQIMEEKDFLTDEEKKLFPDFSTALDSALVTKYHPVLQDLKALFDPINPDKDTITIRKTTLSERQDSEFWLLQQLEDVMEKANFYELSKSKVEVLLQEHMSQTGVRVSVDPDRYAVLRFWALGHEMPEVQLSLRERLTNIVLRRNPRQAQEYFKRVVVAIKLKGETKLILKAFKEVPVHDLEMLLPDGTIQISTMDKGILVSSAVIASLGVLAKAVTWLAAMNVDWMLVSTLVTGTIAMRAYHMYVSKRDKYLADVTRTLYFKNIANNRGLLTLLVDRAEDESFKEALLTYIFLMTSCPTLTRNQPGLNFTEEQLGGLTEEDIKSTIEEWVKRRTGLKLDFDTSEALAVLKDQGLVHQKDGKHHVLMLDAARCLLPQAPSSLISRQSELTEGYDRDEYLETEDLYKAEAEKTRRFGWMKR